MYCNGDRCPKCNEFQMPVIAKDSHHTARACQNCGYVEELVQSSAEVFPSEIFVTGHKKEVYYSKEDLPPGSYAIYSIKKRYFNEHSIPER